MEKVKVYDHAGNEFLAPDKESAEKAVESGQYFFERPDESLADSLGLQPVVSAVVGGGEVIERDGMDRLFVYNAEGKRFSMWAVDAKECVKSGEYFWTAPVAKSANEVANDASGSKPQGTKPAAARRGANRTK